MSVEGDEDYIRASVVVVATHWQVSEEFIQLHDQRVDLAEESNISNAAGDVNGQTHLWIALCKADTSW